MEYCVSKEDFQKNFEAHFLTHYNKTPEYTHHLVEEDKILPSEIEIVVGFFIEKLFPPYHIQGTTLKGELPYFRTKQFCKFFRFHPEVHFVLFGGYFGGKQQLIFIDRLSLPSDEVQIDLDNPEVVLFHMNENEVTFYGNFTVEKQK